MKKANFLTPVVTAFDANGNLDVQANKNGIILLKVE
jgi:hypothetical protein